MQPTINVREQVSGQRCIADKRQLVQRTSREGGLGRTLSSVSSAIGSFRDELDAGYPVQYWVRQHLQELEGKLEVLLQHMTEEFSTEVEREQQHLMLMQSQARLPDHCAREVLVLLAYA